jgi:DNA-directed RNA polymerase subunit RPC12/RpoP
MAHQIDCVAQAPEPAKTRCPRCQSRLDVFETPSGGRTVSVAFLGPTVETTATALELFIPRDSGAEIQCPACSRRFDPSGPVRSIPPLRCSTS